MKMLIWIFGILAVIYIGLVLFIYGAQRKLLYFPPAVYLSPQDVNVAMEEWRDADGDVVAWWSPPATERHSVVMVFHGNGSAIYSNYDIFRDLIEVGHGVLSVGYPGYPGQSGSPTQQGLVDAAKAQYEALLARNITPDRIVFYGTSLGSGVAAQLSHSYEPALLFVDAPFNSTLDMAKMTMRFLPVGLLMKDTFRSDLALQGKTFPLIWTHGTADKVVPLSQGQRLYDGYQGPKEAHIIKGGDHINLWALGGREIVLRHLAVTAEGEGPRP
jgi:fermentation-respiration switch protein FrsA (DUF1100 family)